MKCDTKICHAECCGPVPIPIETYNKYKHLVLPGCVVVPCGEIVSVYHPETMVCGFLDYDYRCRIYKDRPYVCRMFGVKDELRPLLSCHYLDQIDEDKQKDIANEVIERILKHG